MSTLALTRSQAVLASILGATSVAAQASDAFDGLPIIRTYANKTPHRFARSGAVRGILLHGSGSLMSDEALTVWGIKQGVSWNYSVDDDSITVMVDGQFGTYHAGIETWIPALNLLEGQLNDRMISIEFRDTNKSGSVWSAAQRQLAVRLCAALCRMYNIPAQAIFTHRQASVWWKERFQPAKADRPRKIDPVGLADMAAFIADVERALQPDVPSDRPGLYRLTRGLTIYQGPGTAFTRAGTLSAGAEVDVDVVKQTRPGEYWGHLFGPRNVRGLGFILLESCALVQPKWFLPGQYQTTARVNLRTGPGLGHEQGKILVRQGTPLDVVDFIPDDQGREITPGIHLWGIIGGKKYAGKFVYMGVVAPSTKQTVTMRASSAASTVVLAAAGLPILGGVATTVVGDCMCDVPAVEDYSYIGL
ncbi:N-acetylmuramoyl-L-alanine amidase [candidate division WWE3 bacterium]|nr:N-acetylmuramoyl-L-alanine amidase [candidate division WWE3 bacterium]